MIQKKFSRIGFIQFDIVSGFPEHNIAAVRQQLADMRPPEGTLVLLPELWATGFCYDDMQQQLQKLHSQFSQIHAEIEELARKYNIYIAGTMPEQAEDKNDKFYNNLYLHSGNGICGVSRKQNLFVGEEQAFCGGTSACITTEHGEVAGFVCFDLRFPEVSRPLAATADLMICSAQWPKSRINHWQNLLVARAIENQIFVLACNASGASDGPELGGCSMIIAPDGRIIEQAGNEAASLMVSVQWDEMETIRERFSTVAMV